MKTNNKPIWDKEKCVCSDLPIGQVECEYCVDFPKQLNKYIDFLEKENQELKVLLTNTALKDISRIAEIQEQYLKAVESVIKEHHIYGTYRDDYGNSIIMCNCENEFSRKDYREHLLQEIKSAIESTNLPKSQDKSAMEKGKE